MENALKRKIKQGQPVLGLWNTIPSPILVEILGFSGFDFQILDMEHGVFDIGSLDACIRACESTGCAPIVRVPGIMQSVIQNALDLGAHGIIVPQVAGYESARQAVECTKFAPEGSRGYNPFIRAAKYANPKTNTVGKLTNEFGLTSIIIENKKSYEELEKILSIDDLDLIYLGIYDMSLALGCNGDVSHPDVTRFLEDSIKQIKLSGKAIGMMVKSKHEIEYAFNLGANVVVYGVDSNLIYQMGSTIVKDFKEVSNLN